MQAAYERRFIPGRTTRLGTLEMPNVPTYPGGPLVTPRDRAAIRASAERHVSAVFDAERACATVFRGNGIRSDSAIFFDPQLCPSMWERANAVMHHLQTSHGIECVDRSAPGTAPYDPDDSEMQGAVFIHFVNDPNVLFVFRDKAERLSWLWRAAWEEGRCNVTQSLGCTAESGPTAFIPTLRGHSWSALRAADHATNICTRQQKRT